MDLFTTQWYCLFISSFLVLSILISIWSNFYWSSNARSWTAFSSALSLSLSLWSLLHSFQFTFDFIATYTDRRVYWLKYFQTSGQVFCQSSLVGRAVDRLQIVDNNLTQIAIKQKCDCHCFDPIKLGTVW